MDKNNADQCTDFWETMFLQADELDGLHGNYLGEEFPESFDLGSPVEKGSSMNTKNNIVSERNPRKKLTEKLYTLRSVVPNITKMDKESIVRDAIEYIKKLHEEQKKIQAEISDMESAGRSPKSKNFEFDREENVKSKRIRTDQEHFHYSKGSRSFPTEVIQLRVSSMGEETIIISLRCSKRTDTMVKLNEQFASLNLKIINANITAFSDSILMTIVIQADKKEKDLLKIKIERAIAALNDPQKNYFVF